MDAPDRALQWCFHWPDYEPRHHSLPQRQIIVSWLDEHDQRHLTRFAVWEDDGELYEMRWDGGPTPDATTMGELESAVRAALTGECQPYMVDDPCRHSEMKDDESLWLEQRMRFRQNGQRLPELRDVQIQKDLVDPAFDLEIVTCQGCYSTIARYIHRDAASEAARKKAA